MPAFKSPPSFAGLGSLPGPVRGLIESVFPQEPQLPMPIGMAGIVPKPGGALFEVLRRAAEKSGLGFKTTPGEAGLLDEFTAPLLNRAKQVPKTSVSYPHKADAAMEALEEQYPTPSPGPESWEGLRMLKSKLGF